MTFAALLLAPALALQTSAAPTDSSHASETLVTSDQPPPEIALAPSAMVEEPPSPAKLELIRRYLRLTGTQRRIDSGSFLERYAFPGGRLSEAMAERGGEITFHDLFDIPMAALRRAYEPHRQVWQEEYERHVNWEYTEDELREIVAFLETNAGRHFLDGEWRMNAYVGTNTEELLEQIIREAEASVRSAERQD